MTQQQWMTLGFLLALVIGLVMLGLAKRAFRRAQEGNAIESEATAAALTILGIIFSLGGLDESRCIAQS